MLRKLLNGTRLLLTPVTVDGHRGYRFTGRDTYLKILEGDCPPRTVVVPTGPEQTSRIQVGDFIVR